MLNKLKGEVQAPHGLQTLHNNSNSIAAGIQHDQELQFAKTIREQKLSLSSTPNSSLHINNYPKTHKFAIEFSKMEVQTMKPHKTSNPPRRNEIQNVN